MADDCKLPAEVVALMNAGVPMHKALAMQGQKPSEGKK